MNVGMAGQRRGPGFNKKDHGMSKRYRLFGAMSSKGLIYYTEYERTLKARDHINLVEGEFINSPYNTMDDWTFQQDGAKPMQPKRR